MKKPKNWDSFYLGGLFFLALDMFLQDLLGKEWCVNHWVDLHPLVGFFLAVAVLVLMITDK